MVLKSCKGSLETLKGRPLDFGIILGNAESPKRQRRYLSDDLGGGEVNPLLDDGTLLRSLADKLGS